MTSEEFGAIVFLLGYAGLFVLAIKVFGVRRVAWVIGIGVFLAVTVAFKTLGAVTSSRRY